MNKNGRNTKFTKTELETKVGTKFVILEDKEEITATEDILVVCNTCGRIFRTNRRKLVRLNFCPTCGAKKRAKTKSTSFEKFVKKATSLYKNHYTYFEDFYTNLTTKTLIRCNWCGYIFWQEPRNHLHSGCKRCSIENNASKLRLKNVEERINSIGKFRFLRFKENYKNFNSLAITKCVICGEEYVASVGSLLKGTSSCKKCAKSFKVAEERIKLQLYKLGIEDIRGEVSFSDLKYKSNLRFDIFLPDYMTAIEVQGWHHIKPYKYSDSQTEEDVVDKFEQQKIKDSLKREWCQKHNVELIEIQYTKVRRSSGVLSFVNSLKLEKKEYTLQSFEKNYKKFCYSEDLETILK